MSSACGPRREFLKALGAGALAAYVKRLVRARGTVHAAVDKPNVIVMFLADNGGCAEGGPWGWMRGKGEMGTADSHASYGLSWANASRR